MSITALDYPRDVREYQTGADMLVGAAAVRKRLRESKAPPSSSSKPPPAKAITTPKPSVPVRTRPILDPLVLCEACAFAFLSGGLSISPVHPLRDWRRRTGTSLRDLSIMMGASMIMLSRIERREQTPSFVLVARIIGATGPVLQPADFLPPDELSGYAPFHYGVRVETIQVAVTRHYGVTRQDMLAARRTIDVTRPRQVAMYLAKILTTRSLPEIGRRFGGRDHTTVLHSVRKIERLLEHDQSLKGDIAAIRAALRA